MKAFELVSWAISLKQNGDKTGASRMNEAGAVFVRVFLRDRSSAKENQHSSTPSSTE